jgi:hypothetical protein
MSDKLSVLNDTEKAVVDTITMQLSPSQALEYLKGEGYDMHKRTYFRYKKKVESLKWDRLMHIAEFFTE